MKIVERMFQIMTEKSIKDIELARSLDVSKSVVSSWRKRNTNPPAEYIEQICILLNVSPSFLLTGKKSIFPPAPLFSNSDEKSEDPMFYEQFKKICEYRGTTPTQVVTSLGYSSSKVTAWKNGSLPKPEVIEKIAAFLNVPVYLFFVDNVDEILKNRILDSQYNYDLDEKQNSASEKIVHLYKKEVNDLIRSLEQLNKENLQILKKYLEFLIYDQNRHLEETDETISEDSNFLCAKSELEYYSEDSQKSESHEDWKNIRLVGLSAAGEPIELPEDPYAFTDFVRVPQTSKADFAVTIKGDSMAPDISDGSIVFVHEQPQVETGEIAIVSLDHAATCKKFYRYEDRIELVSINKNYKPIIIRKEDHIDIRIIGKVLR